MKPVDVAIVGGGMIGCSVAYHLQRAGVPRIALVEAGDDLAKQTSFAGAGFISAWTLANDDPSRRCELELERYGLEFYPALEKCTGADIGLRRVGLIDIGAGATGFQKLYQRALNLPPSDPLALRRIDREELFRRLPHLDERCVEAAVLLPYAFRVSLPLAVRALGRAFKQSGGTIHLGARVTGVAPQAGRVTGLETTRGFLEAPVVVNAAGSWAAELAHRIGVELPMRWYSATQCVTEPLGIAADTPLVILRYANDVGVYAREEEGGLLFGHLKLLPEHESLPIDPAQSRALLREHLAKLPEETGWMFPLVRHAGLRSISQGFPARPPDDRHYLGETSVRGFYVAAGCCEEGATHGPGLGRAMAELITTDKPFVDISPWRVDRFQRASG